MFGILSDNIEITGTPKIKQPVLYKGKGKVFFGKKVQLGIDPSPYLYSGYAHIEARSDKSVISIGDNVYLNNNLILVADKTSISIGSNVLMGVNVEITDSDFHGVLPDKRMTADYECRPVNIEDNVFIGSNVKILKGVTIGKNAIVSNGSIVTKSIPENMIAAGIPAKVIKSVYD